MSGALTALKALIRSRRGEVQAEGYAGGGAARAIRGALKTLADSDAFRQWFGKSKVVNPDGTPQRVYHGTSSDFDRFDRIDSGNAYGPGYYFTRSPAEASGYALGTGGGRIAPSGNAGPNVMPVYLRIENPYVFDDRLIDERTLAMIEASSNEIDRGLWRRGELARAFDRSYQPTARNVASFISTQTGQPYSRVLRGAGFDGLDTPMGLVVFQPEQIKSALGNAGTFNAKDARITRAKGGAVRGALKTLADSDAFRQWFGKSKVVNPDGTPQRVYHGTRSDIEAFDPKSVGRNHRDSAGGFFFSTRPDTASAYAMSRGGEGANVVPAFLSMQNPLTLDKYLWSISETPDSQLVRRGISLTDLFDESGRDIVEYARREGHDGLYWTHGNDGLAVAFRPEQIKSAIGNAGSFNPRDKRITKAAGGAVRGGLKALKHAVRLSDREVPIVPHPVDARSGLKLVPIDVQKLDAAIPRDWRVGPGGEGGIAGRYERFGEFVKTAPSVHAPNIGIDHRRTPMFGDGRHRFAYFRDHGVETLPVAMDDESERYARELGLIR